MLELKDGNDVAVYLRNQLLAMMEVAREYGIRISVYCPEDGTMGTASFGNYEVVEFVNADYIGTLERYQHVAGGFGKRTDICPQDIRLEKRPDAGQSNQGKN